MSAPPHPDDILLALDPEQRMVAERPRGAMVVLAGAGAGKTRAITHRIAYGVTAGVLTPQHVLALTFTAKAAGEMRTRLRTLGILGVQARTFHAAALRQLQFFWPQVVGGPAPNIAAHKGAALAEAAGRLRLRLDRTSLRDVASEIEWAKVAMITPERYPGISHARGRSVADLDATAVARVMQTYAEVCDERNVIDFEDVLLLMVGILAEHPQIAAAIHQQYRHFVVDEYQDVNPLQQRLLDLWLGDREDLCVVGDPAQTIYSFTGATSRFLTEFHRRFPNADTVRLVRNYRSSQQIVELANRINAGAAPLHSQQGSGPVPVLSAYPDDEAEARAVAEEIATRVRGGASPGSMAVLFRTNAQSQEVETALSAQNLAYLVRGGERFFSRTEVRQAMVLLRGQVRSDTPGKPLADRVRDVLSSLGHAATSPASGAARERWESLQAVVELADSFDDPDQPTPLSDLVLELDRRASEQHAPDVDGVTLASLHAAKGLEWDHVFVIGCSEGLMPISLATSEEQIAEERRLLYVAVTRAKHHVDLSWAASRSPGGRATRKVSRFLRPAADLLGVSLTVGSGTDDRVGGGKAKKRRVPRACRTCGRDLTTVTERKIGRCAQCPSTYDEALFEALRTWRSESAKAASVPAFVVFTDATLTAIAEQTPTDRAGLAQIVGIGQRKLDLYGDEVLNILKTSLSASST
ncbi:MAG: ATP-dependent DNA helicase UvrD2 [Ornithinimicrobium sp.]